MEDVIKHLAEYGILGVTSALLTYLYLRERNINHAEAIATRNQMVENTAADNRLARSMEDLAGSIDAMGDQISLRMDGCQGNVNKLLTEIQMDKAREEGRREATNPRFRIPKPGDEDDA